MPTWCMLRKGRARSSLCLTTKGNHSYVHIFFEGRQAQQITTINKFHLTIRGLSVVCQKLVKPLFCIITIIGAIHDMMAKQVPRVWHCLSIYINSKPHIWESQKNGWFSPKTWIQSNPTGNEVDREVDRFQINNACICVFSYVDISSNIKYDVYRINWYTSDLKGDIGDICK